MFLCEGLTLVVLALFGSRVAANPANQQRGSCYSDDCLQALRGRNPGKDASAFCSSYISQTTPQVTITQTSTVINSAPTTTIVTSIFSTVTAAINVAKRNGNPKVPAYLPGHCASPIKISSACSCLIGTVASPTTVTATVAVTTGPFSTVTVVSTDVIIATVSPSSTSTAPPSTAPSCATSTDLFSSVYLRIEGDTDTIFEGLISSGPGIVTTPSGGSHQCDGTNSAAHSTPGATTLTALNQAACQNGFPFDGTFDTAFDDFFITSISNSSETSTEFWGSLVNYQFTPTPGCQTETAPGDSVQWFFNAFNAVHFLQAALDDKFSTTYAKATVGVPFSLFVRDGTNGGAVAGATIGGSSTNSQGVAIVTFSSPGTYSYKATQSNSIRSNAVTIVVS